MLKTWEYIFGVLMLPQGLTQHVGWGRRRLLGCCRPPKLTPQRGMGQEEALKHRKLLLGCCCSSGGHPKTLCEATGAFGVPLPPFFSPQGRAQDVVRRALLRGGAPGGGDEEADARALREPARPAAPARHPHEPQHPHGPRRPREYRGVPEPPNFPLFYPLYRGSPPPFFRS